MSSAKGTKRTLDDVAFDREAVVDSTAPLKQIINELLQRQRYSKAYKFYHQLIAQRKSLLTTERHTEKHYTIPGHPLKYFKDSWNGNICTNYFEQFQFRSTMPNIITDMRNIEKSDPVTDLITVKSEWQNGIVYLKKNVCQSQTMRSSIEHQLNEDVIECPKYLIDLATRLESDPHPNFDSTYNWYYAGNGNMQLVCINWVDYLLHSEFSTVYLSRFDKQNMTIEKEYSATFDCGKHLYILETICSPENIVALRTQHAIFILKIIENNDDLSFEKLKHFESESSYTGISFDLHHTYILYATTIDSKLTIVNLNKMIGKSVKMKRNSDSLLNNWNCVTGVERSSYMHIERNTLTLYDKRTNSPVSEWKGVKQIVDTTSCNDITAAKHCVDSPSLYFTSDHLAFLMDTRVTKKRSLTAVQRWTHGLKCAPTYISIVKADNNKELITLSSQWCEDTCVISNYANSVIDSCEEGGVTMPYHPPSILEVLGKARLKMLCSDLHNPIEARLGTASTGQVVLEQGENFCILTQNALGDIFARNLHPQYMESFVEDDSIQKLHVWSQFYKIKRKVFEVSAIKNISNIWKKLKKVPDNYNFGAKNFKEYYDESKIYEAFANEELLPELLDAWTNEPSADETNAEQSTLMLNLHYEDSDE